MNNNYTETLNNDLSSFQAEYDIEDCSASDLLDYLNNPDNFLPFSKGITRFIETYVPSFNHDISNPHDIFKFIVKNYKKINYNISEKTIHNWFFKNAFPAYNPKGRRSMYALCFAFGFNIDLTKQFFRKVYFDRCFDCRNMEDAVYFYCLKNNLTYTQAVSIIEKCPNLSASNSSTDINILYTKQIQNKIEQIDSEEELLDYFYNNLSQFNKTKQSAYHIYNELLSKIAVPKKCKKEILQLVIDEKEYSIPYLSVKEWCSNMCHYTKIQRYELIKKTDISSSAFVMKQILDFDIINYDIKYKRKTDGEYVTRYYNNLVNNKKICKLPDIIRQNFPSRNKLYLEKNWEKVSYDTLRKLIILFYFYIFYIELTLNEANVDITSQLVDYSEYSEYFVNQMNTRLHSAGFEYLYVGNPYD